MKQKLTFIFILVAAVSWAQTPKFYEDISPLIYNKCTKCHRPGEIKGETPFMNYEQVSNYAYSIKQFTGTRFMPPWKPDPSYNHLMGENYLTDSQIKLIADWVDGGSPAGDPSKEAPLPNFTTGSQLGTPDLVLKFAQSYTVKNNNTDEYRVFVLPTGLTQNKDVVAVEIRPGNVGLVHHALVSWDTTGQAKQYDLQDNVYGYNNNSFGFGINNADANQYPGYVPGSNPRFFPEGIAQPMYKGSDLLVQMHYAPTPIGGKDSTSVNIFFAKKPIQRYLYNYIMLPYDLVNGPFVIPAKKEKEFHGAFTIPFKVSMTAIWPHCHLLGTKWQCFAVHPNGDTTNLIRINDWDFKWQGGYQFKKYIVLEPGTVVHAFATYDNTTNNPLNPNNPPKNVTWGEKTTDEMYYLPLSYVVYNPGDENVIFEDNTTATDETIKENLGDALMAIAPNPVGSQVNVNFTLGKSKLVGVSVIDVNGKVVRELVSQKLMPAGQHQSNFSTDNLPSGNYWVMMATPTAQYNQSIQILR